MENVPPHSLLFDANYCGLDDRGVTETVLICYLVSFRMMIRTMLVQQ